MLANAQPASRNGDQAHASETSSSATDVKTLTAPRSARGCVLCAKTNDARVTFDGSTPTDDPIAAVAAEWEFVTGGGNNNVNVVADATGPAGNDIEVVLDDTDPNNATIDVAVVGTVITVALKTALGVIASTATEVAAAINGNVSAAALVTALADEGSGAGIVAAASHNLEDGADAIPANGQIVIAADQQPILLPLGETIKFVSVTAGNSELNVLWIE